MYHPPPVLPWVMHHPHAPVTWVMHHPYTAHLLTSVLLLLLKLWLGIYPRKLDLGLRFLYRNCLQEAGEQFRYRKRSPKSSSLGYRRSRSLHLGIFRKVPNGVFLSGSVMHDPLAVPLPVMHHPPQLQAGVIHHPPCISAVVMHNGGTAPPPSGGCLIST